MTRAGSIFRQFVKRTLEKCTASALTGAILFAVHGPAAAASQTVCVPTWSTSETANTTALQSAIKKCSAAGTASLPALVDLKPIGSIATAQITTVTLSSNIVLKLETGFTLMGPAPADVGYTGEGSGTPASMLVGSGLSNVTITGTGTLDGNGAAYWNIFNQGGSFTNQDRPRIVEMSGKALNVGANFSDIGANLTGVTFPTATNDTTQTLKIKNSPKEQLTFESGSSNVLVDGVWIFAPPGRANLGTGNKKNVAPNTDGIDLTGLTTATVQNCLIDTGDDDIAIKSNKSSAPTNNVTVKNCVFGGGHGLSVGGQETGGVNTVTVSNVWFKGTDFGFKVKTDNSTKDSGTTNGASYTNSCMLNVGEPIQLTYLFSGGTTSGGVPPTIENISYNNIIAVAASTAGQSALLGEVTGLSDDALNKNIKILNSKITGTGAKNFTVTNGSLFVGSKSTVATTSGSGGSVAVTTDTGPTVSCPTSITIPEQL
ncbi:MAG TPA: glycosyl hydrolase family 28 protein [Aliidongia sp.]|nr:glycosyl hydrolase family 28 protein [Aliidongia sp.]